MKVLHIEGYPDHESTLVGPDTMRYRTGSESNWLYQSYALYFEHLGYQYQGYDLNFAFQQNDIDKLIEIVKDYDIVFYLAHMEMLYDNKTYTPEYYNQAAKLLQQIKEKTNTTLIVFFDGAGLNYLHSIYLKLRGDTDIETKSLVDPSDGVMTMFPSHQSADIMSDYYSKPVLDIIPPMGQVALDAYSLPLSDESPDLRGSWINQSFIVESIECWISTYLTRNVKSAGFYHSHALKKEDHYLYEKHNTVLYEALSHVEWAKVISRSLGLIHINPHYPLSRASMACAITGVPSIGTATGCQKYFYPELSCGNDPQGFEKAEYYINHYDEALALSKDAPTKLRAMVPHEGARLKDFLKEIA